MKLNELINWYSSLTPETLPQLSAIYHEQASFRDPFNEVRGQHGIAAIFEHMFEVTQQPVFRISSAQTEGTVAWVSWTFDCRLYGRSISIDGVTRLDFADDGRVMMHRDYWDALDMLAELPLLGPVLRLIRRKLGVPRRLLNRTR
ncbi:MAG: nuclear transport factor 2 family protein [Chromatiaceae bacterium]|nr:nuclear transport factor 2 family protein [Chromatiaceae bacterium]